MCTFSNVINLGYVALRQYGCIESYLVNPVYVCTCVCMCLEDFVEFPDCEAIQRRTSAFQRRFVEHFLTLYSSLPSSVQTSALSVAVRRRSNQPINDAETSSAAAAATASSPDVVISLHQYLDASESCAEVPLQLPASEYALTVSPTHFDLIRRARVDGCADSAALARLIIADVAAEAATELSRSFEYQLVLLGDEEGLAARLGAQRGAERAMEYLKLSSRHVDTNSLLRGVVEGRPAVVPATVSVIIGRHSELHWNVDDMFLRPGLRRERLLVAGGVQVLGGYGTPWRFYASTDGIDATLYGYRGQLLARDFHSEWVRGGRQPSYCLDVDEETSYDIEVPWRTDDFHRSYRPYRRLVGSAVLASYAALSDEEKSGVGLAEFVQRLQGDAFRRDEVEPVFRPLTPSFRREEFTPSISKPNPNFKASPVSRPLTSHGFCGEESVPGSNLMPESHSPAHDQSHVSATDNCREGFILASSSTMEKNSLARQSVDLLHDSALSNGKLTDVGSCGGVAVHETVMSEGRHGSSPDQPATCSITAQRRPPPPVVKPKPSLELRRRVSTNFSNGQTMTSLPAAQRQSSTPVDGSNSSSEVTVRFPTLDELFGAELAAIRRSSAQLTGSADTNSHPASNLSPLHSESTETTSSAANDDVTVNGSASQRATTLLTSDI